MTPFSRQAGQLIMGSAYHHSMKESRACSCWCMHAITTSTWQKYLHIECACAHGGWSTWNITRVTWSDVTSCWLMQCRSILPLYLSSDVCLGTPLNTSWHWKARVHFFCTSCYDVIRRTDDADDTTHCDRITHVRCHHTSSSYRMQVSSVLIRVCMCIMHEVKCLTL